MEKSGRKLSFKARNPDETKARILNSAIDEFADFGFLGARVERIALRSDVTMRMLYHYYKSKAYLYGVVLAHVFEQVESAERDFRVEGKDPKEKIAEIVAFAFDLFAQNATFVKLAMGQNFLETEHRRRLRSLDPRHEGLIAAVGDVLREGQAAGLFRGDVDPAQLWAAIYSLSWGQLATPHTFGLDLSDMETSDCLVARRAHAQDVVLAYLRN